MSNSEKSVSPLEGSSQDKPRLTDEQKRRNHITSEQKRREAIRSGFDKLADMVPGLHGAGRSEGYVLNSSVAFMVDRIEERRQLVQRIEALGGQVPDELKEVLQADLSGIVLNDEATEQHERDQRAAENGEESSGGAVDADHDQDEGDQDEEHEDNHINGSGFNGTA